MEKQSWNEIKKEKLSDEINHQMIWGKNLMAVRFELSPNSFIPIHKHESEQLTMVQNGRITLHFADQVDVTLGPNEMLLIPSMVPHSGSSGPEGCDVIDLFSPIRQDFIDGTASYFAEPEKTSVDKKNESEITQEIEEKEPYSELHGYLAAAGIRVPIEKLREYPLEIIARYAYEKECVTMGQLRAAMGIDKKQAKDMLRTWKHGDDHSESSYKRSLERIVIAPNVFQQTVCGAPSSGSDNTKERNGREKDTEN
ncbi:MAG: cupin domain-containing protein [Deltaproteobacteria bacterium]|nr:cupin domain-containing protein [Deltaproteobacteria bacterium]